MSDAPEHEPQWVDTAISRLLRTGVAVVILLGLVLSFAHHPQYVRSRTALGQLTDPGSVYPHRIADVLVQIRSGHGQAVIMLGLLMLIATPVARVAFSIAAFAIERDRLYVTITSIVLLLLLLSFAIGATE